MHGLAEADKVCPRDGTMLEGSDEETSEQLEIIPTKVKVLRNIRLKYAPVRVVSADKPAQPLGKSVAAPGLLAYVATSKYADALSLCREDRTKPRR